MEVVLVYLVLKCIYLFVEKLLVELYEILLVLCYFFYIENCLYVLLDVFVERYFLKLIWLFIYFFLIKYDFLMWVLLIDILVVDVNLGYVFGNNNIKFCY